MPEFKFSNGIGVFNAWNKSKNDGEIHALAKYLVRWVANSKLIFIGLLILILIFAGTSTLLLWTMLVMALTTIAFFVTLFPIIRKADKKGQISPKNYSIVLFIEVFVISGAFIAAFVLGLMGIAN